MIGVAGNSRKRARIAASGAKNVPMRLCLHAGSGKGKQKKECLLRKGSGPKGKIRTKLQTIHAEYWLPETKN
jgi:hypothetical protein